MPNKQMAHNHKAKVLWPLPKDPSRNAPNNLCPSARTEIAIYDRPGNYLKNHKTPENKQSLWGVTIAF